MQAKLNPAVAAGETYTLFKAKGLKPSAVLGVTHTSGKYHFTKKPFLAEGAAEAEAIGFRVLKLWFDRGVSEGRSYRWNSTWNAQVASLAELARESGFQDVFSSKAFDVFILEAAPFAKRTSKLELTPDEAKAITAEYAALTGYLLKSYAGSGKTFVLQNWEGDNALAIKKFEGEQRQARIDAMAADTRARQAGVDEARARVGEQGVRVLHALEMNWVPSATETFTVPLVVDELVPKLPCDLYSISSWFTKLPRQEAALEEKLRLMQLRAPAGRKDPFCFMVGEFGAPEAIYREPKNAYPELQGSTGDNQLLITKNQVEAALRFGARYAIYWELYCNEWRKGVTPKPEGVNAVNEDLNGFWLVRPDGSKAPVWHYFHELFRLERADK